MYFPVIHFNIILTVPRTFALTTVYTVSQTVLDVINLDIMTVMTYP
jgi:hypothetical protein